MKGFVFALAVGAYALACALVGVVLVAAFTGGLGGKPLPEWQPAPHRLQSEGRFLG